MKILFLTVSGRLPAWLENVTADYRKRISHWVPVEVAVLKGAGQARDSQEIKLKTESAALMKQLGADDYVILCDERGRGLDSVAFSKQLERVLQCGKKRLVFIVGGAYGVTPDLKEKAQLTLKLSDFTLNHHLAFLVAHEQLYRAFTILKGLPYHNS